MDWTIEFDKAIEQYLPDLEVLQDEPMSRHTTFRIGGPAKRMAFPSSREQLVLLMSFAKDYGAKGLAYIAIQEDGTVKSSFAKFMTEEEMQALIKAMDGENGDLLLFAADKNKIVYAVLGALRCEIADKLGLLDKDTYNFLWITEFPLFEYSDEEERYVAGFAGNSLAHGRP